ncbi:MAG: hypothetical protein ACK4NF_01745 [Planctomycetota bacterium]
MDIENFKGKISIVDTDSSYIYIGKIEGIDKNYIIMENVDVHDVKNGVSTREQYILTVKKIGLRPNRNKVYILKEKVISISLLDDVVEY